MCVYVYVYIYIYINLYLSLSTHIYIYIYIYIHIHIYVSCHDMSYHTTSHCKYGALKLHVMRIAGRPRRRPAATLACGSRPTCGGSSSRARRGLPRLRDIITYKL